MAITEVILLAAGKGTRIGAGRDKPFILLNKKPLLFYSLKVFQSHPKVKTIILVVEKNNFSLAFGLINKYHFGKVKIIVSGGRQRKDSVVNGIKCISNDAKYVLIHDAARPFTTKALVTRIISKLNTHPAVIPGFPAQDTLKQVSSSQVVVKTLNRKNIYHIQTPQGFRVKAIKAAATLVKASSTVYDDSMLLEQKIKVKIVRSDPSNFKITTPSDLRIASLLLNS